MAIYLKSCDRCGGDMNSNRDMYGEYRMCLQCGHIVDIPKESDLFSLRLSVENAKKKAA